MWYYCMITDCLSRKKEGKIKEWQNRYRLALFAEGMPQSKKLRDWAVLKRL